VLLANDALQRLRGGLMAAAGIEVDQVDGLQDTATAVAVMPLE
jgi:hypothetical protein